MIAALLLTLIPTAIPTDVSLAGAETLIAPAYDPPSGGRIPKLCWLIVCPFHGVEMITSPCFPGEEEEVCNERLQDAIAAWTNRGHPIMDEGPCN